MHSDRIAPAKVVKPAKPKLKDAVYKTEKTTAITLSRPGKPVPDEKVPEYFRGRKVPSLEEIAGATGFQDKVEMAQFRRLAILKSNEGANGAAPDGRADGDPVRLRAAVLGAAASLYAVPDAQSAPTEKPRNWKLWAGIGALCAASVAALAALYLPRGVEPTVVPVASDPAEIAAVPAPDLPVPNAQTVGPLALDGPSGTVSEFASLAAADASVVRVQPANAVQPEAEDIARVDAVSPDFAATMAAFAGSDAPRAQTVLSFAGRLSDPAQTDETSVSGFPAKLPDVTLGFAQINQTDFGYEADIAVKDGFAAPETVNFVSLSQDLTGPGELVPDAPIAPTDAAALVALPGLSSVDVTLPDLDAALAPDIAQPPAALDGRQSPADRSRISASLFAPALVSDETVADSYARLLETGYSVVEPARVNFRISATQVRYFYAEDETAARSLGEVIDAQVRDFTDFRPSPPEGTIEIWLAGRSRNAVAAARPRPQTNPLEQLRSRILQQLRSSGQF